MSSVARKTLIFHIGDHKTGSTSIQAAFASERVRLDNVRIFFPAMLSHNWLKEHFQAYGAKDPAPAREKAIGALSKLAANIRQADAELCLISGESLEAIPAPLFKEIVDRFFADTADDIRVVAYVRPHAGRITSGFAERTKTGLPNALKHDLDSFFATLEKNRAFIYAPRFTEWRNQFGDNFILRPMIRDQLYRKDVVSDFVLHALGTDAFTIAEGGNANESLLLEDLMRLKVLQKHLQKKTTPQLRHAIGWEFARIVGQMPPPETRTKIRLHKALAEQLRDSYLDDARTMDRLFFGGQPLLENDLEHTARTAPPEAQSMNPADHLSASEIRSLELNARLVAGLLKSPETKWPAFLRNNRIRDIKKARAAIATASE